MRSLLPFTSAAALTLAVLPAAAQQGPAQAQMQPPPRIVVTGEGEAKARPDLATLTLSVMREAETAREALDANSAAMAAVIAAMKTEGVAENDLQTAGFGIQPRYTYPSHNNNGNAEPQLVGYQVTNTLGVRVRDITKVGDLLDKAVSLGVNQGGDISFGAVDPEKPLQDARKDAVSDAMARARTLAEAAGVTLGSVLEITETSLNQPPVPMMKTFEARSVAAEAVPIEAGQNTYRVQVTVTFAIEP
nr:SIMPL domain-containing protein [Tianweitania sediminis]